MKIKKRSFIKPVFVLIVGVLINVVLVGYMALLAAFVIIHKIKGLEILFDTITAQPAYIYKSVLFGNSTDPLLNLSHSYYTNMKLQAVYWIAYLFFTFKIMFSKSKNFSKLEADKFGTHGTARWSTSKEVNERFFQTEKGMILGEYKGKPCIQGIDTENNHMCLIYGGSGSGKTAGYSIPNILHISETLGESFVVTDPKGDIYNATVPTLEKLGYKVYRVNLLDFRKSNGYNSLEYVTNGPEAMSLASTIINNTSGPNEKIDFWGKAEKALYGALIMYLVENRPKEERHIANVLRLGNLIGRKPKLVDKLFMQLPDDSTAKNLWYIFANSEEKTRSGILIGFGVRLQLWADKEICKLTSRNDFNIRILGQEKAAVFILTPDEESTFDLITAMFIDQTFQELTKEARTQANGKLKNPVRMILDEIANIAPVHDLQKRVSVMRSRGVRISLIFQGIQQFKNRYGDGIAAAISDSCDNQIVLRANDLTTAEPVSKMLGNTTILTNSINESSNDRGSSLGMNYSMQGKSLMDPNEIRTMPKNKMILFQTNSDPVYMDKYFWFKQDRWKDVVETSWTHEKNRESFEVQYFKPEKEFYEEPAKKVKPIKKEKSVISNINGKKVDMETGEVLNSPIEDEYGPTLPYVYENESDFSNLFDSMPPEEETSAVKESKKPKTVEKQEEFNLFG